MKLVRALQQKKYREKERLFLAQGAKVVRALITSDMRIGSIYATETAAAEFDHPNLEVLPRHEMERLGTFESGNELIAVVHMPEPPGLIELSADRMVIALDGITDPGNLGTVLRIADWFGMDHVICSHSSVDVFNPKCVQASMGAVFHVKVTYTDLPTELERLQQKGASLYLASMEGGPVFDQRLERPAVLVLGSEAHGLSEEVRRISGQYISIPGSGRSESLNVATAAAALCMEFDRQFRAG